MQVTIHCPHLLGTHSGEVSEQAVKGRKEGGERKGKVVKDNENQNKSELTQ